MSNGRRKLPFVLDPSEAFDSKSVPPYRGDHSSIYRYIDEHLDEHLERIRRWLRQPSVSTENIGVEEMAGLLREDLDRIGFHKTELVPTDGHPGVWGLYDAGAPKTLMLYLMYDVQPVNAADWRVPPFAAELVENEFGQVVMARGAKNQKGPERALLNAIESIIRVEGQLPVNLMVTAEGEEELGSPHYPQIIDNYEDQLRTCIGVLFPHLSQNSHGAMSFYLGVKGLIYFELEARGGPRGGPTRSELHGSLKGYVDSPVLRLIQAVASLTTPDGNTISVPGYYEPIRAPNQEELRLAAGMLEDWEHFEEVRKEQMGVERWADGIDSEESLLRDLFDTTLNVDGIWAGWTGPGVKTIIPHVATAKLDSRLVPNQNPEEALELIRQHLADKGFDDVELRVLAAYPPAQTSVEAELVLVAVGVFNKYGHTPAVAPRVSGSAPFYQFTDRLGIPLVFAGLGYGARVHAPDEYMVIDPAPDSTIAGLAEVEKAYVDLIYAVASV